MIAAHRVKPQTFVTAVDVAIENPEAATPAASVAAAANGIAVLSQRREDHDRGDDVDCSDAGSYSNDPADDDPFTRRHAPWRASPSDVERARHRGLDDEHRGSPARTLGESSPPDQTGAAMYAETAAPKRWALADKMPYICSSDGSSLGFRLGHGPSGSGVGRSRMFHYQRLLNHGALTAPSSLARSSGDDSNRHKSNSGGRTTAPAKMTVAAGAGAAAAAAGGGFARLSREWSLLRNTKTATRARTNKLTGGNRPFSTDSNDNSNNTSNAKCGYKWLKLKSAQNVTQVLMRAARRGSVDSDESSDVSGASGGKKGSRCLSSIWSDGSDDMLSDSSWSGQSLEEASAMG